MKSENPSGKWVQRIPKSLHARLQMIAVEEGVSLNHLVLCILAASVGNYHINMYPPASQGPKQTEQTAAPHQEQETKDGR